MSGLIKCKACGESISAHANACPKCGHPAPAQINAAKAAGITTLVIVALIIWGAIRLFGGDTSTDSIAQNASEPAVASTMAAPNESIAATPASSAADAADPSETKHEGWVKMSNDVYALEPTDGSHLLLVASIDSNTHRVGINFINGDSTQCADEDQNGAEDLGSAGTFKINDTMVKFRHVCLAGSEIEQPYDDAGKNLLNNVVSAEQSFTIETGDSRARQFNTSGFKVVERELLATNTAL